MDTQDWYTVNEFAPGSYQITEGGRFNMLLLVGDEKALSIDGGIGIGNLDGVGNAHHRGVSVEESAGPCASSYLRWIWLFYTSDAADDPLRVDPCCCRFLQ